LIICVSSASIETLQPFLTRLDGHGADGSDGGTVATMADFGPDPEPVYTWDDEAEAFAVPEAEIYAPFDEDDLFDAREESYEQFEEDDEPMQLTSITSQSGIHGSSKNNNVIVYPGSKLAFCYIPKVACAVFNAMFDHMNHLGMTRNQKKRAFALSKPDAFGLNRDDISMDKGWKFGFFLRDPLSRFLSAWGSKCIAKDNGHGDWKFCGGLVGDDSWPHISHPSSKEELIAAFEQHVVHFNTLLVDGELKTDNKHYVRQADMLKLCGDNNFWPGNSHFIGLLSGNVHQQVEFMLRGAGFDASEQKAERFFPEQHKAGHSTSLSVEEFFRNNTIAEMVADMYAPDFALIREATFSLLQVTNAQ